MAAQFSPPYDIAVHPRYRDAPFDELPKWLQNRIERYSVPTENVEEDAEVEEEDDQNDEGTVGEDVDESGDPMPVDVEFPHHKGGGYYVLSNGSVVRGADEADEEQSKLRY